MTIIHKNYSIDQKQFLQQNPRLDPLENINRSQSRSVEELNIGSEFHTWQALVDRVNQFSEEKKELFRAVMLMQGSNSKRFLKGVEWVEGLAKYPKEVELFFSGIDHLAVNRKSYEVSSDVLNILCGRFLCRVNCAPGIGRVVMMDILERGEVPKFLTNVEITHMEPVKIIERLREMQSMPNETIATWGNPGLEGVYVMTSYDAKQANMNPIRFADVEVSKK